MAPAAPRDRLPTDGIAARSRISRAAQAMSFFVKTPKPTSASRPLE
jgi:hypothetical protein